jgi:hypothetical protein
MAAFLPYIPMLWQRLIPTHNNSLQTTETGRGPVSSNNSRECVRPHPLRASVDWPPSPGHGRPLLASGSVSVQVRPSWVVSAMSAVSVCLASSSQDKP